VYFSLNFTDNPACRAGLCISGKISLNFTDNPACRAGLCISEIQTGEQNFTDISD